MRKSRFPAATYPWAAAADADTPLDVLIAAQATQRLFMMSVGWCE